MSRAFHNQGTLFADAAQLRDELGQTGALCAFGKVCLHGCVVLTVVLEKALFYIIAVHCSA